MHGTAPVPGPANFTPVLTLRLRALTATRMLGP